MHPFQCQDTHGNIISYERCQSRSGSHFWRCRSFRVLEYALTSCLPSAFVHKSYCDILHLLQSEISVSSSRIVSAQMSSITKLRLLIIEMRRSDVFFFSFSSAQNFENINSVCVIMPPSSPGRMISCCSRDNSPASTDNPGYFGGSRIRKSPVSLVRIPRAERRTQIWTSQRSDLVANYCAPDRKGSCPGRLNYFPRRFVGENKSLL